MWNAVNNGLDNCGVSYMRVPPVSGFGSEFRSATEF